MNWYVLRTFLLVGTTKISQKQGLWLHVSIRQRKVGMKITQMSLVNVQATKVLQSIIKLGTQPKIAFITILQVCYKKH